MRARSWCSFTARRLVGLSLILLTAVSQASADDSDTDRILDDLVPRLETYIEHGMAAFDTPGLAVGIVSGDELVYANAFGVRRKGGDPVDTRTVFQIGSTSKAFLATTLAIAVDRGAFRWDDRVVDLDPAFQLMDPWVTREFRVFDIVAQRSGLPPYVNDIYSFLGFDRDEMIRSLRFVEPRTSFRSTFTYTNVTHLEAGRLVARAQDAPDWENALRRDLFEPLGMADSSANATAIETASNHAIGHRWTPDGTIEVPFTDLFPYNLDGAGAINSTVEDMARWLRLQLGNGTFEGRQIVSPENLAATRTARIGVNEKNAYAMGWALQSTPNGEIVWHNGGTLSFGAFVGFLPSRDVGIVVLTNAANVGFPDAVGLWVLDRFLGNPETDYAAETLSAAKAAAENEAGRWAAPSQPSGPPEFPTGTYRNDAMGAVTVTEDGTALAMAFATGAVIKLTPWNDGIFLVTLAPTGRFRSLSDSLGPDPLALATFQPDRTGQRTVLSLMLEDGQTYVFRRDEPAPSDRAGE
ncbi:serine hydrolase [Amorphus orientalis]|uniref:CubicO group peptidase (Beta-lactamase class C family) n=1 Tax=Amorphus orientalis TaxID=649198 RepID=A0AAE3VQU1_9HYPH|nr:serine hydrolase [Amorphus orientalis]MDQ0316071.1 CubicO group peptidase (beta-lactamase class C family) [Amorphus orientalis]